MTVPWWALRAVGQAGLDRSLAGPVVRRGASIRWQPVPQHLGFRTPASRCAYRWRTARSALDRSRLSHSSPTDLLWDCRGRLNPAHVSFRNRVERRAETAVLIRDGCTWETCPKAYFPYLGRGLLGPRRIVGVGLTTHAWERTPAGNGRCRGLTGRSLVSRQAVRLGRKRNVPRGLPEAHYERRCVSSASTGRGSRRAVPRWSGWALRLPRRRPSSSQDEP